MSKQAFYRQSSLFSRVAAVSLIAGLVAACSSDTSRFSENPFSNPFSNPFGDRSADAQVASAPYAAQNNYTPAAPVNSYPVASVSSAPIQSAPVHSSPVPQAVVSSGAGGWTANGGTPVTVAQGDSLNSISNRYGVPSRAILSANGLSSPSQVAAGSRLVIPVYSANAAAGTKVAAAPSAPVVRAPAPVNVASNTLNGQAAKVPAQTINNTKQVVEAQAANASKTAQMSAQKAVTPPIAPVKTQVASAKAQAETQIKAAVPEKVKQPAVQMAAAEPAKSAASVASTAVQKDAEQTASLQKPSQTGAEFRWPAKGRVISGFASGGKNEGINISVPEGTPVRAAESGVVTFAGDDVKSYGNLVLIKHDNGYISAYAHNGSLNVKRGDKVSRGQVIAKSGQTGDVTSPQLHFEIRKGQTPVDPVPYLGG